MGGVGMLGVKFPKNQLKNYVIKIKKRCLVSHLPCMRSVTELISEQAQFKVTFQEGKIAHTFLFMLS